MTRRHPERRTERVVIRMTARQRLWLLRAAASKGMGEVALAREAIGRFLEAAFPQHQPANDNGGPNDKDAA